MAWTGTSGVALCHPSLTNRGLAIIRRALRRAGWSESAFYVCRPGDIPAGARAAVALGDSAQVAMTGWEKGKRAVKYTRGYVLPSWTGLPVVPTFDPEDLGQGQMKLMGLFMRDLGTALAVASGRGGVCNDPASVVDYKIGVGELRKRVAAAKADPSLVIAFDLETEASRGEDEDEVVEFSRDSEEDEVGGSDDGGGEGESEAVGSETGSGFSRDALDIAKASITTVQFSIGPGTGVSCQWDADARELTQELMLLPNPRAGHNTWLFDLPILVNHGITITDIGDDTMWMWHHLQPDLPAHLQGVSSLYEMPFPWKHMAGADLDFYGAADVDAVQRIMRGLPRDLSRLGLWDAYCRFVRGFRPLLADMERRGIPVSKAKLAELREWLMAEVGKMDGELQAAVPGEVKGRKYWKTWPADTKEHIAELKEMEKARITEELEQAGKRVTKKALNVVIKPKDLDQWWRDELTAKLGYLWEGDLLYRELDFNPRSPKQLLDYLKHKGYPIPKRFKDGKDSTSDKELERLEVKTGDPALKLARSIRAYSKMSNAYAGKVMEDGSVEGGWQPGPDGRLRATFTFGPATGQLAARNPNVLTTPKRRPELAKKFRECLVAEPEHKLIEIDMRAFHARTTGLAASSANYMRLSDLDIHSFLAGHLVHHPGIETCLTMSDADLKAYLGEIKKLHKAVRDFKAKPTILGVGFKMGHRRLFFENRDSMANEAEAKRLLDTLKSLFPEVFRWQDEICEQADRDGRLVNSWGAVRWFWDVYKWQLKNGEWRKSSSKDAEKVVAFLPSSNAHYMLRDKLLQANDKGWLEAYGLVNVIHDAVLFHCPDRLVDECVHNVRELLEAPVPQMAHPELCPDGFTCGAEASVGPDWARMEEVK